MKTGYEKSFAEECENAKRSLNNIFTEYKKHPYEKEFALEIRQLFERLQRSAEFMECSNLERLFNASARVFSSVYDGYIFYSKRLERLLIIIERNMENSLKHLLKNGEDAVDVEKTIGYCDKVSSGEIVEFSEYSDEDKDSEDFSEWIEKSRQINSIPVVEIDRSELDELFNDFDNMIFRTFRIEKEADLTGNQKITRNLKNECQVLRNEIEEWRNEIDMMRMLPFSTINEELKNKYQNVEFDQNMGKIRLDSEVLTTLAQVLPVFFQEQDKKIQVTSSQGKYETKITIFDQTMKIDFDAIRGHAVKLFPEMMNQIADASEKELSAFLFIKSFSSDSRLSRILKLMDKVRGKIYVQNRESGGAETVLIVPNSLSTRRGLFVKAGTKPFFIPAGHIQDVIAKWSSELFVEQNQYFVDFEDKKIPVYRLSSLLKEKVSDNGLVNLLIIEYLEMRIAIAVDEVSAYSSITFKALPEAFKNFDMYLGVAVDNERHMIPILNTVELMSRLRGMRGYEMKKMEVFSRIDKPRILVVDDSDTSREIEGSILQANGFAVDEAADGILAMEKLKSARYNVIVTDTEMPRMNGLIFLENVRLMENYKDIPVIVMAPNEDESLIHSFKEAGANAFLSKNNFKRSNLIGLVKNFVNGSF